PDAVASLLYVVYQRDLDHPDLPSSPTRRSSDLPRTGGAAGAGADSRVGPVDAGAAGRGGRCLPAPEAGAAGSRTAATSLRARTRSEEHTSELQSRENLVCRLLLEKKELHTLTDT